MNKTFKAILVTGARQVGKTTMLKHLAKDENRTFVSMDDSRNRELANSDPNLFFQMYKAPILIDEVQKAPKLFEHIKLVCDNTDETGLFWLTGSESVKLMKEANESLAGRICILKMYGLSLKEKLKISDLPALEFDLESLIKREKSFPKIDINDVYNHIFRGTMPGTLDFDNESLYSFYSSYIDAYLLRDAVDDNKITDTEGFRKVLRACASFIGNLVNYSDLASAGSVSVPTVKNWLKVLQNMGILYFLEPFSNNNLKRLVKTPKLYFCDTGLAAFLSMWANKDVLMNGASSGQFFENFVVSELIKNYAYAENKANLTYYRDTNQKEIDVLVEENGVIYPIEIKRSANPDKKITKSFEVLNKTSSKIGAGSVICMSEKVFPVDSKNIMIPSFVI